MNKALVVALLALSAGAMFAIYNWASVRGAVYSTTSDAEHSVLGKEYENAKYGIAFSYPSGYELSEHLNEGSELREHYTIVLVRTDAAHAPQDGESPPTITFDIYQNNLDSQTTEEWIRNTSQSNFKLSPDGTLMPTTVDGKNALMYRWDGLYTGTTIALAEPQWVYALSVNFLTPQDEIVRDFAEIVQTVQVSQ